MRPAPARQERQHDRDAEEAAVARGDVPDHPLAADHREGDDAVSEASQVGFKVAIDATKPEIKAAVEGLFGVKVACGEHAGAEGQDQAVPRSSRRPVGLKKAIVTPGRRPVHRFHHRPRMKARGHGTEAIQPGHAEPARHGPDRPFRAVEGQAGQGFDRGQAQLGRAQQPRPHHRPLPRRRTQAGVSRRRLQARASSTCRRRSSGWNTIRTARPSSR